MNENRRKIKDENKENKSKKAIDREKRNPTGKFCLVRNSQTILQTARQIGQRDSETDRQTKGIINEPMEADRWREDRKRRI